MATKKAAAAKTPAKKNSSGAMTEAAGDRLGDSKFAFPNERKEPLNDAKHVRNAIARFDQVEDVTAILCRGTTLRQRPAEPVATTLPT
ncbi:MAG: DUF6582 domain-containing protein [Ilumatobacteraceae bacterium]